MQQQKGTWAELPRLKKGSRSNRSELFRAEWTQERKLQRQKEDPFEGRFRKLAWDELLLPLFPLLQVSWELLELRRKKTKIHT